MKKKKGLSYDEKRDKMLKIFHDSVIKKIILEISLQIRLSLEVVYKSWHTLSNSERNS